MVGLPKTRCVLHSKAMNFVLTDRNVLMFTSLELNRASSESSDLSSGSASPERATSPPRGPDIVLERGGSYAEVNTLLFLLFR